MPFVYRRFGGNPKLVVRTWVPEGSITADVYMDMENGSIGDALTTGMLSGMCHGIQGSWQISPSGVYKMSVSDSERQLITPVTVSGTTYSDIGSSRGIASTLDTQASYVNYIFSPRPTSISIGLWVWFGNITGADGVNTYRSTDWVQLDNEDGKFFVANTSPSFTLRAHGAWGVSGDIAISPNVPYWLTMKGTPSGICSLYLYNQSGTFVGSASGTSITAAAWRNLRLGCCDTHGNFPSLTGQYAKYDDLLIDVTDATFPLGPYLS